MKKNNIDWFGWIFAIFMLSVFWPVGVFLLIKQISKIGKVYKTTSNVSGRTSGSVKRHPYDIRRDAEAQAAQAQSSSTARAQSGNASAKAPSKKRKAKKTAEEKNLAQIDRSGRILAIVGAAIAGVFGLGLLSTLGDIIGYGFYSYHVSELFPLMGFFAGGLACLGSGFRRRRQAKRFRKYLSYIGKNRSVDLAALASAMGEKEKTVYKDLQEMLEDGILPMGYVDIGAGRLILSDEGISEPTPAPKPEPAPKADEYAVLREIRAVNDAIPDQVMSAKIDRIGEITGKILDYQRSNPGKSRQLRSFLDYYLPTTLKVLRAYAQLDAQGIEGENISAAKKRIEEMMDQVVYGFEKQLDRLFQNDAMDIATDVEVLENMLKQDGLSGNPLFTAQPSPAESAARRACADLEKMVDDLESSSGESSSGQGITLEL